MPIMILYLIFVTVKKELGLVREHAQGPMNMDNSVGINGGGRGGWAEKGKGGKIQTTVIE